MRFLPIKMLFGCLLLLCGLANAPAQTVWSANPAGGRLPTGAWTNWTAVTPVHDWTLHVGAGRFGVVQWNSPARTVLHAGHWEQEIALSAPQAAGGFILLLLLGGIVWFVVRGKSQRPSATARQDSSLP